MDDLYELFGIETDEFQKKAKVSYSHMTMPTPTNTHGLKASCH